MLKAVFMGTAPFAAPSLRALADAGHTVLAAVTQPDRPQGRGMKLRESAVKVAAREPGIPVLQPEKASLPEFVAQLRDLTPDVIVVVAYGQILRPTVLEIPALGCINVHGSLLPELRGAAPIQWAVIRGCHATGVTTIAMDAGMDTGDILLQAPLDILPDETAGSLSERMAPLGADLLVRTLTLVEAGAARRRPQEHHRATYAPQMRKEDGAISWTRPAAEIVRLIHGCNPSPGAFARRGEQTVLVWRATEVPDLPTRSPALAPGTVIDAGQLLLATTSGAVRLIEVQPENRARMSAEEYARGYRVTAGEVWEPGA